MTPEPTVPPETSTLAELRAEVRAFLADALPGYDERRRAESWQGFDRAFSRRVGARGWIGMNWPCEYGGGGRSLFERHVVQEEMLAFGAPIGAHCVGERQSGPLILRVGTDEQKRKLLPGILAGELSFCIGMSESEAGSDLVAIRTRATRCDGGWKLTGRKLWTTLAAQADIMIVLARTAPIDTERRHAGISQFLLDLRSPGVTVTPIRDMTGGGHFNEVVLDEVFLEETALLGAEGQGWGQVMSELSLERSGPERFLSSMPLISAFCAGHDRGDAASVEWLGMAFADLVTLRELSLDVVQAVSERRQVDVDAAIVKSLGAEFEQSCVHHIASLTEWDGSARPGTDDISDLLCSLSLVTPSFSLRGGSREILRGIIAKSLKA